MNYISRSIDELVAIANAELAHTGRLTASIAAWRAYGEELEKAFDNLEQAKIPPRDGWLDDAGKQFDARTRASSQSIRDKHMAAAVQRLPAVFADLEKGIIDAHAEVMAAYAAYMAALAEASAAQGVTAGLADAAQIAQQRAGAALNALGAQYNTTAQKVQQASGPGIVWNGPAGSGGDGPGANGGPATTAAPGGAPGGAPAGGAPAGGAPAGGAPAGGAPAGGAPAGGAPAGGAPSGAAGGAGGGPSLAGATPSPVMPTVPPVGGLPSVPPPSMPTLPPVAPIGAVPTANMGGVFGGGRGFAGGVTGLSSAPTSIPKASNVTGAVPAPAAGQAPQVPAAGGARPAGGATPGFGGVPPMMPPMAGAAGAGGKPKPGNAEKTAKRTARPPRTVPGVPPELRGRAGKLDAKQATLFPAARSTARDDENATVELIDEDLWQVAEQEPNPLAGRG